MFFYHKHYLNGVYIFVIYFVQLVVSDCCLNLVIFAPYPDISMGLSDVASVLPDQLYEYYDM